MALSPYVGDGAHRATTSAREMMVLDEVTELLDALSDPVCIVDRQWQLRAVNGRFAELWGRDPASRSHTGLTALLPRENHPLLWSELERAARDGTTADHEAVLALPGLRLRVCARAYDDGLVLTLHAGGFADGPDDAARLLAAARRAAAQAVTLQQLTAALSSALSEEQVGAVVLSQALPAFGATAGDVILLTDDDRAFRVLCWMGYPEHLIRDWMRYPVDTGTPSGDIVGTGAPVFLSSFAEWEARYPRIAPIIGSVNLAAYAGLPLTFGGRVVGAVSFNFPGARNFSAEERAMLLAFASQCAQALERARLFTAEQRARLEAESATRAKSDFLAVMSHELRTPLTSILGYQELIADGISGPVTDLQRQQLSRIEASALHLLGLIDELLTFSRLETGHETVQVSLVDVAALLDDAAALVAPLAAAKGLPVVVEPRPDGFAVTTDAVKLRQVLVNLLSNAIKFTEHGAVTLGAQLAGDDVEIAVRDTGIGIAPEHLERIFEPFRQIEQHSTRRAGGTGLGLSVTRRLLGLLGGTIAVESTVGQGSTFRVRVPGRTDEH